MLPTDLYILTNISNASLTNIFNGKYLGSIRVIRKQDFVEIFALFKGYGIRSLDKVISYNE